MIAAITSCTNTSNPSVMVAAGLLAKKAAERGMQVPPHVKTSLAPGSRVVTDYLDKAGLTKSLEALGISHCRLRLHDLHRQQRPATAAGRQGRHRRPSGGSAVLSGNRNFEGRVNPLVQANYLASPPLVVAYALAGSTDVDLLNEPLGRTPTGTKSCCRKSGPRSRDAGKWWPRRSARNVLDPIRPRVRVERKVERH